MSDNEPATPETTSPDAAEATGWTCIPVLYRDAGNWKSFGDYVLAGKITPDQRCQLAAALATETMGDEVFIPTQIGEDHLNEFTPSDDDHPWHELRLQELTVHEHQPREQVNHTHLTVTGFIAAMTQAHQDGWDPVTYDYP